MRFGDLCLVLVLALLARSTYAQSCTLITSNVLRVDSEETFLVDGHGTAFDGDIIVQDFPKKKFIIAQGRISVNNGNGFWGTSKFLVPSTNLDKDPEKKQFVYVSVRSGPCNLEKVVLVSYQSGYIFIQTDKPIYSPGSQVLYRIYCMALDLNPANKPVVIEVLNPDKAIVKRDVIPQTTGIISYSYRINDLMSLGVWTLAAKFENAITHYFTTNFEVKEYAQPVFEVNIRAENNFYYIQDYEFKVQIHANYLNGKPVDGAAYVLFSVMKTGEKKSLPSSLRRIAIEEGKGSTALNRKDIVKNFQQEKDMLQWRLSVSATVISEPGSDMVETELDDIHIVTSPYKVLFTKTSKFFKPGLPMDLMIIVSNPDGTPAHRVPVVAEPGMMRGITQEDGTLRLTINTRSDVNSFIITVKTTDPRLSQTEQASASFTATAYQPVGGNYLLLRFSRGELKVGENAAIDFVIRNTNPAIQNQITHFNYIILTKGRIVRTGTQDRSQGQSLVTLQLQITPELIPSFRILAYYVVSNGENREVVADSLWIDVADTCMGTLMLSGERERDNAVQSSGAAMKLKLRADHKASVALVAVDKGVYTLNNTLKMSQTKVWDTVEKYNTGCTVGGGADAAGVFYDAGLALVNNFHGSTPQRSEVFCQPNLKRRRRGATIQTRNKREDEDLDFLDSSDIISRTDFPKSWLWKTMTMNEAPDANGVSSKIFNIFLKDSITTWEVLAVSLSENKGICVSKPYDIRVMQSFSIDLQLPYSVVRNEQVEIRAILYNYHHSDLRVRAEWTYNEEFCSLSTAKSNYQQFVTVKAASSLVIPFVIVPLTLGDHDVEVKASRHFIADGVRKKLKVVPKGKLLVQNLANVVLDPEGRGRDGVQEEVVKGVDIKRVVPDANTETIVTVQGAISNQLVDKVIDGINMNHLIVTPSGHGEAVIMAMTSNVICAYYLDATHQWEKVGVQRRTEAIQQINDGLMKLLAFRKQDGSYAWLSFTSSTLLNAYVVKVFALAQTLINIEQNFLCDSVKWLILERQKANGLFQENNPIYQDELAGGLKKGAAELEYTFTAFVLIALMESEDSCTGHVNQLKNSIQRSTAYIEQQYPNVRRPYSIAITSYALARAGKLSNIDKLMSACTDNNHWEEPDSRDVTLEATSYGLLTLVKMKEYDKAAQVVEWLIEQKFYGQTQRSTQSTIMVFQSMAQYYLDAPLHKDVDMTITLNFKEVSKNMIIKLTNQNALIARSYQIPRGGDFVATATGKGQGSLSVVSMYYANETEKERPCNNFYQSLKVQNEPLAKAPEGTLATVSLTICTRYLKSQDSGMVILQVSMMTGFAADFNDLKRLQRGVDRYISNFELNKGHTDTLLLYIDKISHTKEECLKFNLHQYFKVGLIQPASVTVYEYYSPENRCTKFYHVNEESNFLATICEGEVCRCAEEKCFMKQNLEEVDAKVRFSSVCEPKVDYAYKTTLSEIKDGVNYFNYVMIVTDVIKQGMDVVQVNQKRNFISHSKCHKALNLEVGRDYLVWGDVKDLWNLGSDFSYMVTKDTWIEMWPKKRECEKSEYETLCDELNKFQQKLTTFGCP